MLPSARRPTSNIWVLVLSSDNQSVANKVANIEGTRQKRMPQMAIPSSMAGKVKIDPGSSVCCCCNRATRANAVGANIDHDYGFVTVAADA
jgi:hypothetical protein